MSPEESSFIERLRRALGPTFRLDGKVAQGGMGTVYRAFDLSLNRSVAVKTLPLEATAEQVERFHREAQTLAQLSHPCIVPVYQVSSHAQDIHYYVMQWMEGETVQTRLSRGPLSHREAVDLGIDLLSALAVSHKHKVIHRDVKPANVFLVDHRTVLGDFGIAKPLTGERTVLTAPAQMLGTPAYMAPEQWEGGQVTESTDIYAVGLLLYEAMCGRRLAQSSIDAPDWSKVPRRLAQVLRRALAKEPSERWPDADSFITALRVASRPRLLRLMAIGTAAVFLAVIIAIIWEPDPPDFGTIAITSFDRGTGIDSTLTNELAELLHAQLKGTGGLQFVPRTAPSAGQAKTQIVGRIENAGVGGLLVQVSVQLGGKELWVDRITGHRDSLTELSNRLANLLMIELVPQIQDRELATLSKSSQANKEFIAGEITFRNVHWSEAEEHYDNAHKLDSTFALASWRLANVRRWRRLSPDIDLKPLLQQYGDRFGELDRMLLEAEVEPDAERRFERYGKAIEKYPQDGIAWLFYGDQLMHRGPLTGHYLREALEKFEHALAIDPTLAAAWFHIGWIHIRLGNRADAQNAVDSQLRWLPPGTAGTEDIDLSFFLQLAFNERFAPQMVGTRRPTQEQLEQIVSVFRWAISFDIPEAQLKYGRLTDSLVPYANVRASAHSGQGIALVALGRPLEALAHFDQAQTFRASAEADLHRAQWRVLPTAMGWYSLPEFQIDQGRRLLTTMLLNDSLAVRAAWTLALDAAAANAWRKFEGYYRILSGRPQDVIAVRLRTLLDADTLARKGRYGAALATSLPLLAFDSAGRVGDPFARAVLRLERGEWYERSNQLLEADRQWLWYENTDLAGEPIGEVQPIEVDWAVENLARLRRARVNLNSGHFTEGCGQLRRVTELWSQAEPELRALADSAAAQLGRSPCTQ